MALTTSESGNYVIAHGTKQEIVDHMNSVKPYMVLGFVADSALDLGAVLYLKQ